MMTKVRRIPKVFAPFLVLSLLSGCGVSRTALNDAVFAGDPAQVARLLDAGAPIEAVAGCEGDAIFEITPLMCAIEQNRPEIVRLLVARGASVNQTTKYGYSPLKAAAGGDVEMVRYLLDLGAEINLQGTQWYNSHTPLMLAVDEGKNDVARLLLERGADVEARSIYGWTALGIAARERNMEVAKLLLSKGADIDYAISHAEEIALEFSDREWREKHQGSARFLRDLKATYRACAIRWRPDPAMREKFSETAAAYRAQPVKPALPEEGRVFRVQAEDAVAQKRFQDAVELYGKALAIAPWWPEGHFNQALILGESECPEEAIGAMERYLSLVPDAADARAARDRIYVWKGRLP